MFTRVHPSISISLRYTLLFSAATDGKIAVWDLTEASSVSAITKNTPVPSAPCLSVPAHQSGINSLAAWVDKQGSGCQVTVASGGDDGQLTVSVIKVQFPKEPTTGGSRESSQISGCPSPPQQQPFQPSRLVFHLNSQHRVPTAHAAPLTSLKLLRPGLVVSTSADQRVCLWEVGSAGVRQIGSLCSHVADAAGLAVWEAQGLGDGSRNKGLDSEQQNPMREGRGNETGMKKERKEMDTEGGCPDEEGTTDGSGPEEASTGTRGGKARWALVCGQGFQLLRLRDPETEGQPS